jgi:glutamine---fructose-6-phosphate transaminase (isomerizing)
MQVQTYAVSAVSSGIVMGMSTMLEEIRQQPAALERTLQNEWRSAETLRRTLSEHSVEFIIIAARGTSDNAAQFARYLLEIATGIPVSLAAPSIATLYHSRLKVKNCAVVAISQSGESTDTNLFLERAKEGGAFTVGITNESESSLARLADHLLLVQAGREKSVAATKTYTGQLLCCYLLAYALGARVELDALRRIPEWVSVALELEEEIRRRAERYRFMRQAVSIGRGLNYSNSLEFALKLMETCYVVAERFSSADLLHGPIAMLEASFPAFVFCPPGVTWESMNELLQKLQSVGADMLLFTDRSNDAAARVPGQTGKPLTIPAALAWSGSLPEEVYTPIPYIIPAQLFAASLAEIKNLNPDQPRTLQKVTQTL